MQTTRQLFGTDGVRGLANREPMTPETAVRLGRAVAQRCAAPAGRRARIVIGKDTRLSGAMLEHALAAGICSAGVDVLLAGVLPTPAVAFLTRTVPAEAGAVVSASHNPFADNGIKFFAASGFKLPDAAEAEIEHNVLRPGDSLGPIAGDLGSVAPLGDAEARYIESLATAGAGSARLAGLTVVIDAANGAAFRVGPQALEALGARVVTLGTQPDGTNINAGCGAVHPQALQAAVLAQHAALGIALDGDADRLILVDERGEVVDGDEIMALVADDLLARGALRQATVVATVMSNLGLERALRVRGARLVRTAVGDRYVVEEMRRGGYNFGGEQSGHLVLLDHSTTGDGLLAAVQVLHLMVDRQRPLSELKRVMTKLPQALVNVRVARRQDVEGIPAVRETIARVSSALGEGGRVLVRCSGTEPLVRVMVEGDDAARVRAYAEEIAASIGALSGA